MATNHLLSGEVRPNIIFHGLLIACYYRNMYAPNFTLTEQSVAKSQ